MIDLRNISFSYRKESPAVLRNISLHIDPGEKVLIAGRNGAGKTTLSKILSGLIPGVAHGCLTGRCLYEGKEISDYPRKEITRKIAILFQDFEAQMVSTSVREEMLFYLMNTGVDYQRAAARVREIVDQFSIAELLSRDIHELSGGEKQKIALVSLLAVDPAVLILDEPFTDIEPASQEFILAFLIGKQYGGALILFEQALDYYKHFDRIVILQGTESVYDGDKRVVCDSALLEKSGLEPPGIFRVLQGERRIDEQEVPSLIRHGYAFDNSRYTALFRQPLSPGPPLIEVRNLSFRYKGRKNTVLHDVNLLISASDFITVLGPNGSGKTTLMKLIAGILKPASGEIYYKGSTVVAGDIGYVYQNPDNQIFAETVFDEIAFVLRMRKLPEDEIQSRVETMLSVMGLSDKSTDDPFILPKGDREKIACASILVAEPEVIILDEPTTGLDYPSLTDMMRIITTLHEKGKTILIITHSMETAARYGSTVVAMHEGTIIFNGPARAFFADDKLLSLARAGRTDIMNLSLSLNGKLLLHADEFKACWSRKESTTA
jgi:energy-coupling factor transport system ATP-binding protein